MPKSFKDAEKLDKKNENTKCMDYNKLEHEQLDHYEVFINKGEFAGCRILTGF